MRDPALRLAQLRRHLEPPWGEARAARVRAAMDRQQRRTRTLRAAGCALLLLLIVLGAGPRDLGRGEVRFADGSSARPEAGAALRPLRAPGVIGAALDRGAARFRVAPDRRRLFRVESGPITIESAGAEVVVSRRGAQVAVFVESGEAQVRWLGGAELLVAGAAGTFPRESPQSQGAPVMAGPPAADPRAPAATAGAAEAPVAPAAPEGSAATPELAPEPAATQGSAPEPAATPEPAAEASAPLRPAAPRSAPRLRAASEAADGRAQRAPAERPRWQDLAQDGDYDRAFALLRDGAIPRDDPQELLLAADVARLSRHPEAALPPLQQTVDHHPDDPRAPLAAFTLGRVLLDGLGRPRQAAAAFRAAQELHPQGPLAQDALAREVEAWSRADEERLARQRALEYLRRYPAGPRQRAVRRHGGLE